MRCRSSRRIFSRIPVIQDASRYLCSIFRQPLTDRQSGLTSCFAGTDHDQDRIRRLPHDSRIRDLKHRWRIDQNNIEILSGKLE
jgi:hypothetical protein